MSALSFLDNIGAIFEKIFKASVPVLTEIQPVVDALVPAPYAALYDEAVHLITLSEAAFGAAGVKNAGPAKLAFVTASLHPKAQALAYGKYVSPTIDQTKAFAQSVVDGLKAYQAITTS